MKYFWDTTETIPAGVGFDAFAPLHIAWLCFAAVVIIFCSYRYRCCDRKGRGRWQKNIAGLLLCNELFKHLCLLIGGNFMAKYLPLHLCSINIFIILFFVYKPIKFLGDFLYLVCIPGAAAALLFPSWGALPFGNFMHLHSFTVHILLMLFPIMLTVAGDIQPNIKSLPQCLALLVAMAIPLYGFNLLADTNFMFLMYAEPGSPLLWFQEHWGNHLLGYPVLITAVIIVMYIPMYFLKRRQTGVLPRYRSKAKK